MAAGLIYGQVKKLYQRRRLVGVIYLMRCGTREALRSALRGVGLSGKLTTAIVERVKKDAAAKRGGAHPSNLVDDVGDTAAAATSGVVAHVQSHRAAA